jgi:hypothetical protein
LSIFVLTALALVLPYLPVLLAKLRGEQAPMGRLVFGDGSED